MWQQEPCVCLCVSTWNVSNLGVYCFSLRGRRWTVSLLCWSGEEKRGEDEGWRLVICSCSSLAWWQRRRGTDREKEKKRKIHLFPILKFTDRNTCATLSHNTAYDRPELQPPALSPITCISGQSILLLLTLNLPLFHFQSSLLHFTQSELEPVAGWLCLVTG